MPGRALPAQDHDQIADDEYVAREQGGSGGRQVLDDFMDLHRDKGSRGDGDEQGRVHQWPE